MSAFFKFWKNWKSMSPTERKYTGATLKFTRKLFQDKLFNSINRQNIISIYIIGSFPNRELRTGSDVDFKIIVKDELSLESLSHLKKQLKNEIKQETSVEINMGFYKLNELRTGHFEESNSAGRHLPPYMFVRNLNSAKRLYGEKLKVKDFYQHTTQELMKKQWTLVNHTLNQNWGENENERFVNSAKFTMHLINEIENYKKGMNSNLVKKELVKSFSEDEEHLIHTLYDIIHNPDVYLHQKEKIYNEIRQFLIETKSFIY